MNTPSLIWFVILLPLLGWVVQAFAGPYLQQVAGKRVVGALGVLPIALAFLIALPITQFVAGNGAVRVEGPDWINVWGFRMPFEWLIDPLSMTMVLVITGIGALIHLYSTAYMADEPQYSRFFAYLNLFIVAMLVLVLGGNLGLLFIGWEGVGLCSYLLIGFWYRDQANATAANKAFIVNRIGDWSLMLGMFLLTVLVFANQDQVAGDRALSYDVMLPALGQILAQNPFWATAIALLLFGGAAGKSAQFPLYVWLPDAMAGPTPVSALIHAATMVTSGVVLLNRMNIVFQYSPVASAIICVIGAFTALFAALIAFGQTDIKKVLAYSTVSQLGFMFVACGAGAYWAGMFHVTTHAFFKALLFLGAGAVIHAMAHDQDMRNYGNLRKYMPITFITMVIGWLAIAGVIPFAGFYSKEAVIGSALAGSHAQINGVPLGVASGWVALGVAFLTAVYMTRLTWLTFFGNRERWRDIPDELHASLPDDDAATSDDEHDPEPDHGHHGLTAHHTPKEVPAAMWIPLVALAVLSVGGGYVLYKIADFQHWLYPEKLAVLGKVPYTYPYLFEMSIAAAIGGIIAGVLFYLKGLPKDQGFDENHWSPIRRAQANQFGFDALVTNIFGSGGRELASQFNRNVEDGLVDGAVNGSGWTASWLGGVVHRFQTGAVRLYALVMLIGGVAVITWVLFAVNQGGFR